MHIGTLLSPGYILSFFRQLAMIVKTPCEPAPKFLPLVRFFFFFLLGISYTLTMTKG